MQVIYNALSSLTCNSMQPQHTFTEHVPFKSLPGLPGVKGLIAAYTGPCVDKVREQCTAPGKWQENLGNHDISVNEIWGKFFSLKLCSWGRKHLVRPCLGTTQAWTIHTVIRICNFHTLSSRLDSKADDQYSQLKMNHNSRPCHWAKRQNRSKHFVARAGARAI